MPKRSYPKQWSEFYGPGFSDYDMEDETLTAAYHDSYVWHHSRQDHGAICCALACRHYGCLDSGLADTLEVGPGLPTRAIPTPDDEFGLQSYSGVPYCLAVRYTFYPGRPSTYYDPPEPPEIQISSMHFFCTDGKYGRDTWSPLSFDTASALFPDGAIENAILDLIGARAAWGEV